MDMTKLQCTISHVTFDQPTYALTDLPFKPPRQLLEIISILFVCETLNLAFR